MLNFNLSRKDFYESKGRFPFVFLREKSRILHALGLKSRFIVGEIVSKSEVSRKQDPRIEVAFVSLKKADCNFADVVTVDLINRSKTKLEKGFSLVATVACFPGQGLPTQFSLSSPKDLRSGKRQSLSYSDSTTGILLMDPAVLKSIQVSGKTSDGTPINIENDVWIRRRMGIVKWVPETLRDEEPFKKYPKFVGMVLHSLACSI